jgi:hypothetical protein
LNYDNDLRQKIKKFQYACDTIKGTLKDKTSKDTVFKFHKVMAVLILMNESECWAMNKADRRAVEAAEMTFIRHVAGYIRKGQVCIDIIRQKFKIFY